MGEKIHLLKANDLKNLKCKGFAVLNYFWCDHRLAFRINSVNDQYFSFSSCLIALCVVMVAAVELAVVLDSLCSRESGLSWLEVGGELH